MNLERTRQQLRELESLLQQMLAVPSEEPAAPVAEVTRLPAADLNADNSSHDAAPVNSGEFSYDVAEVGRLCAGAADAPIAPSEPVVSLRLYDSPPVGEVAPEPASPTPDPSPQPTPRFVQLASGDDQDSRPRHSLRRALGWAGLLVLVTAAAIGLACWLTWPQSWEVLK